MISMLWTVGITNRWKHVKQPHCLVTVHALMVPSRHCAPVPLAPRSASQAPKGLDTTAKTFIQRSVSTTIHECLMDTAWAKRKKRSKGHSETSLVGSCCRGDFGLPRSCVGQAAKTNASFHIASYDTHSPSQQCGAALSLHQRSTGT